MDITEYLLGVSRGREEFALGPRSILGSEKLVGSILLGIYSEVAYDGNIEGVSPGYSDILGVS